MRLSRPGYASFSEERPVSLVRINANANGTKGSVEIDGNDVSGMTRGFRISAGVGELTVLELELIPRQVFEYEGEAFVRLSGRFEEFLESLGWKRPRGPA
jgi:hypothetical protein